MKGVLLVIVLTIIAICLCSTSIVAKGQTTKADTLQSSFSASNPFSLTLYASFSKFEQEFDTEEYIPAKIEYLSPDGETLTRKVKVKSRGMFRKRECALSPIKINFSDKDYSIDVLNDFGAVKMVNQCQVGELDEQYLVKEYLCYKIYELLTDYSFRTYFVKIRFVNTDSIEETFTNYAFLIEDDKDLAKRNDAVVIKTQELTHADLDTFREGIFTLFLYMIGNTDFYVANQHNLKLVREKGNIHSPPIPIPYDFDYSGFVNAHYAKPDKSLKTKSIRERVYFGNCRSENELNTLIQLFLEKESQIVQLINNNPLLEDEQKQDLTNYIDQFFEIITDDRLLKKNIYNKCW